MLGPVLGAGPSIGQPTCNTPEKNKCNPQFCVFWCVCDLCRFYMVIVLKVTRLRMEESNGRVLVQVVPVSLWNIWFAMHRHRWVSCWRTRPSSK